jgi:tRNA(Arg) A34 adenosine deaminase TadA
MNWNSLSWFQALLDTASSKTGCKMLNMSEASVLPSRRRFLSLVGIGCLAGSSLWTGREADARQSLKKLSLQPIAQPNTGSPHEFIVRAFEMKQLAIEHNDQAYGAVVVKDNKIIGQSWSRVILDNDPTGHAEMSALRDAARRNNRDSLSGATLYSTSHPCRMCEAAAEWVGIGSMVHGRLIKDAGAPHSCSG